MQFAASLRHDRGSNTVAFALVAPLIISVFLAVVQIANLVNLQTVISAAAKTSARTASRFDATNYDGITTAEEILFAHGISKIDSILVSKKIINGIYVVEVEIKKTVVLPWLNYAIRLESTGRSVDEKYFQFS